MENNKTSPVFLFDNNVLNLKDSMAFYYNVSYGLAFVLFAILFFASIFQEQLNHIGSNTEPNYIGIFKRAVIILCALLGFNAIFFLILGLCENIANTLFNQWEITKFYDSLLQYKQENPFRFSFSFLTGGIEFIDIMVAILIPLALIIEQVILILRYCLLAVLYIIGPLALVSGLWKPASTLMRSWFVTLFQLSFWIVIFRVIEAAFVSLGTETFLKMGDSYINAMPLKFLLISIVFIGLLVISLAITEKVVSGANLGTIGSAAVGVVTAFASKTGITNAAKTITGKTVKSVLGGSSSSSGSRSKSAAQASKGQGGSIEKSAPKR